MMKAIKQNHIIHYGVDAGSVSKGNLCWTNTDNLGEVSTDLSALANSIIEHLNANHRVTIGVDCPLFWPCPDDIPE